jgi:hypothetical protein
MRRLFVATLLSCLELGARVSAPATPVDTSLCTAWMLSRFMGPTKSGCCSHHGGVCACSNGRAKCCDGTLSPSCGC